MVLNFITYETLKKAGLDNYYWRYIDRVILKVLQNGNKPLKYLV